eukprot:2226234-Karenia_brevis.AAC.1
MVQRRSGERSKANGLCAERHGQSQRQGQGQQDKFWQGHGQKQWQRTWACEKQVHPEDTAS